jgi:DNA helicase II / ATP-dependent DNA helicase PcrA
MACAQRSRERFVTELTLEPPEASSDESGPPLRDEDYLILSTLHSSKGQEWNAVHILNVSDGCMPADIATGRSHEIEEERRLLYVGMTRARDELSLWVPQRFHITQQRALGHMHLYALRSRFVPDALLPHFTQQQPEAGSATPRSHAADAPPLLNLAAVLRAGWPADAGNAARSGSGDRGQNPG